MFEDRCASRSQIINRKPAVKVWSNKQSKGVNFGSAELELNAGSGMYIRLNEGNRVNIHSRGSLTETGKTWDVRAHSVDPTAPTGSNAANGWI